MCCSFGIQNLQFFDTGGMDATPWIEVQTLYHSTYCLKQVISFVSQSMYTFCNIRDLLVVEKYPAVNVLWVITILVLTGLTSVHFLMIRTQWSVHKTTYLSVCCLIFQHYHCHLTVVNLVPNPLVLSLNCFFTFIFLYSYEAESIVFALNGKETISISV